MSSVQFRTLEDSDFPEWCAFHDAMYGKGYVLTDQEFLSWYLKKDGKYETLIAVDGKTVVGVYGVLQVPVRVKEHVYDGCWFVSGMVRSEYRNQGIGKTFVNMLLDRFDICGIIGFNKGVQRNYVRAGFKQFDSKTLRRFVLVLRKNAYSLIQEKYRENMKQLLAPHYVHAWRCPVEALMRFDNSIVESFDEMKPYVTVNVHRTTEYLNWRYFQSPKVRYECNAVFNAEKCRGYIIARHEQFYPTSLYATRIIDLVGLPYYAGDLLAHIINKAQMRNDAFIDFSYTGDFYTHVLKTYGFSELLGENYGALPLVSSPMEYRENEEFICLGSRKQPNLFDDVEFNDLYFTRGDSDRDRYNPLREQSG